MNKKQLFTAALAASVITTGLAMMSTNAAFSGGEGEQQRPSREEMQAHHDAMKSAIEANDYNAWAEAMANHPKAEDFVNEETFAVMVQAHELMEAGDKEAAKALLEEQGIHRPGKRGEHGPRGHEPRAVVREAVEAGDYQAWAEAMADHPGAEELVTPENFATLQEAHALMEAGDKEAAKTLLEEAGFKRPGKFRS